MIHSCSGLFSARNESGDITHKYLEILQERQQYNRDIAEIKQESQIYSNTRFLLMK
jgi:chorismate mutase